MTISNGSAIVATDLDTLVTTDLGLVQDDNEGKPLGFNVNFFFHNLVAGTAAARRKSIWVPPHDYYLEALAVQAGDQTAASTVQAAVTGDGTITESLGDNTDHGEEQGLVFWPVKVSGAAGAGTTKLARVLLDNTKGKARRNFPSASQAFRTLLAGSTITVSVKTTSVATPSLVMVTLVMRQLWARG